LAAAPHLEDLAAVAAAVLLLVVLEVAQVAVAVPVVVGNNKFVYLYLQTKSLPL
jgi:hypothetical protein